MVELDAPLRDRDGELSPVTDAVAKPLDPRASQSQQDDHRRQYALMRRHEVSGLPLIERRQIYDPTGVSLVPG